MMEKAWLVFWLIYKIFLPLEKIHFSFLTFSYTAWSIQTSQYFPFQVRMVRTAATSIPSTTRLPRYQPHQPSQGGGNNNKIISHPESGNGSSSKSSHFINCREESATTTINHTTTVRDVLTRQIKNSKVC